MHVDMMEMTGKTHVHLHVCIFACMCLCMGLLIVICPKVIVYRPGIGVCFSFFICLFVLPPVPLVFFFFKSMCVGQLL